MPSWGWLLRVSSSTRSTSIWPSFEIAGSGAKKPLVSSTIEVDFFGGVHRTKAGRLRQVRVFAQITEFLHTEGGQENVVREPEAERRMTGSPSSWISVIGVSGCCISASLLMLRIRACCSTNGDKRNIGVSRCATAS